MISHDGRCAAQVTPHYRWKNADGETVRATECFECAPKASRAKTYPVCTIRNTPDKPIHCIVWAKELLFARLFGPCAPLPLSCLRHCLQSYAFVHLPPATGPHCFPVSVPGA